MSFVCVLFIDPHKMFTMRSVTRKYKIRRKKKIPTPTSKGMKLMEFSLVIFLSM